MRPHLMAFVLFPFLLLLASCTQIAELPPKQDASNPNAKALCAESGGSWEQAPEMPCTMSKDGRELQCGWEEWCRCPSNKWFDDAKGCTHRTFRCLDTADCRLPVSQGERRLCVGEYHDWLAKNCGTTFT